jgi:hypothetical protein
MKKSLIKQYEQQTEKLRSSSESSDSSVEYKEVDNQNQYLINQQDQQDYQKNQNEEITITIPEVKHDFETRFPGNYSCFNIPDGKCYITLESRKVILYFEFIFLNPGSPRYKKKEIISEEYSLPDKISKIFDWNEDQMLIGSSKNILGKFSYKLGIYRNTDNTCKINIKKKYLPKLKPTGRKKKRRLSDEELTKNLKGIGYKRSPKKRYFLSPDFKTPDSSPKHMSSY